ncbi:hypothetical protein MMC10_002663 [Thelotrema lepadinum]|nr:hypothetical protein [Thelotrema lepadinum]
MTGLKIDTHHHILPPRFVDAWSKNTAVSHGRKLPPWSPEQSLEFMDKHGIQAAILSLGAQATSIGQDRTEVATFTREMNEDMAALRDSNPARFGFFACLPSLEDTAACVDEIQYALDVLHADGINLLTSYGSKYLGHPDFAPVWNELNHHAAVIFLHPGLDGMEGIQEPRPLPSPILDWTHETTRAAAHLIMTDTITTHCKVILSHGGGTLPFVANRIANLSSMLGQVEKSAEQFLEETRGFYFDLALAGYKDQLRLLLEFAKPEHILYGTDYPFAREHVIAPQLQAIDEELANRSDAQMIGRDAALKLFPRLAALLM